MKRIYILLFLFVLFACVLYYWKNPLGAKVKINDKIFLVGLAVTSKKRERGLSGRASMPKNRGMLFLFGSPGVYHFWMKDMKFPLDFVWISGKSIVDIDENIQAPKGNERPIEISPDEPIDKVLELNAGSVKSANIQIGDRVDYSD